MAEASTEPSVDLTLPFLGPIHVTGALTVVLLLNLAIAFVFYDQYKGLYARIEQLEKVFVAEHLARAKEHEELECASDVEIFIHQYPRGQINWDEFPSYLQHCWPDFAKKVPKGIR